MAHRVSYQDALLLAEEEEAAEADAILGFSRKAHRLGARAAALRARATGDSNAVITSVLSGRAGPPPELVEPLHSGKGASVRGRHGRSVRPAQTQQQPVRPSHPLREAGLDLPPEPVADRRVSPPRAAKGSVSPSKRSSRPSRPPLDGEFEVSAAVDSAPRASSRDLVEDEAEEDQREGLWRDVVIPRVDGTVQEREAYARTLVQRLQHDHVSRKQRAKAKATREAELLARELEGLDQLREEKERQIQEDAEAKRLARHSRAMQRHMEVQSRLTKLQKQRDRTKKRQALAAERAALAALGPDGLGVDLSTLPHLATVPSKSHPAQPPPSVATSKAERGWSRGSAGKAIAEARRAVGGTPPRRQQHPRKAAMREVRGVADGGISLSIGGHHLAVQHVDADTELVRDTEHHLHIPVPGASLVPALPEAEAIAFAREEAERVRAAAITAKLNRLAGIHKHSTDHAPSPPRHGSTSHPHSSASNSPNRFSLDSRSAHPPARAGTSEMRGWDSNPTSPRIDSASPRPAQPLKRDESLSSQHVSVPPSQGLPARHRMEQQALLHPMARSSALPAPSPPRGDPFSAKQLSPPSATRAIGPQGSDIPLQDPVMNRLMRSRSPLTSPTRHAVPVATPPGSTSRKSHGSPSAQKIAKLRAEALQAEAEAMRAQALALERRAALELAAMEADGGADESAFHHDEDEEQDVSRGDDAQEMSQEGSRWEQDEAEEAGQGMDEQEDEQGWAEDAGQGMDEQEDEQGWAEDGAAVDDALLPEPEDGEWPTDAKEDEDVSLLQAAAHEEERASKRPKGEVIEISAAGWNRAGRAARNPDPADLGHAISVSGGGGRKLGGSSEPEPTTLAAAEGGRKLAEAAVAPEAGSLAEMRKAAIEARMRRFGGGNTQATVSVDASYSVVDSVPQDTEPGEEFGGWVDPSGADQSPSPVDSALVSPRSSVRDGMALAHDSNPAEEEEEEQPPSPAVEEEEEEEEQPPSPAVEEEEEEEEQPPSPAVEEEEEEEEQPPSPAVEEEEEEEQPPSPAVEEEEEEQPLSPAVEEEEEDEEQPPSPAVEEEEEEEEEEQPPSPAVEEEEEEEEEEQPPSPAVEEEEEQPPACAAASLHEVSAAGDGGGSLSESKEVDAEDSVEFGVRDSLETGQILRALDQDETDSLEGDV
jgi:hypothetical protein